MIKKSNSKSIFDEVYKVYQNFFNTSQDIYKSIIEIQEQSIEEFSDFILQKNPFNSLQTREELPAKKTTKNRNRRHKIGLGLGLGLMSLLNTSSSLAAGLTEQMSPSSLFNIAKISRGVSQKNKPEHIKIQVSVNDILKLYQNGLNKQMEISSKAMQQFYSNPFSFSQNMYQAIMNGSTQNALKNFDVTNSLSKTIEASKEDVTPKTSQKNLATGVVVSESSKLLKKLRTVSEEEKNLYAKGIATKTDSTKTKDSYKPEIKTQHLDMLKELKAKFSDAEKDQDLSVKQNIKSLNEITDKLVHTPTGAFFKHVYAGKRDMEQSLSQTVKIMLNKILQDKKSKNRIASEHIVNSLKSNFKSVEKDVTELCQQVLINSTAYGEDYYTFYHGHGNALRLYIDLLREIKSYEVIQNLDLTNPLRDKSFASKDNTVDEILDQYEEKALDFAARNNVNLYDSKRGMGVGFAPDKIEFFRDNVISTNINLFGNMNTLAECTLFYWLDSFNISNPNEALVKNLLKRILPNVSEDILNQRMAKYTNLYNDLMKETGGNLMQIHVHKSIVDDISFASWMKGIPVLLDKETGKLATRGSNNKPVPVLTDKENKYERPKSSSYMDLFTENPDEFISKYSDFSNKARVSSKDRLESYDRPQMRLIIDPKYFNDPELVKVSQFTRFKASEDALDHYQQNLKNFLKEDVALFLEEMQKGKAEGQAGNPLTKLNQFVEEGTEFIYQKEVTKGLGKKGVDIEDE